MASALRAAVPVIATSGLNVGIAQALFTQFSDPKSPVPLANLNPTAMLSPVGCTEVNLHPVQYSGENSAAGLGKNTPSFIDHCLCAVILVHLVYPIPSRLLRHRLRSWAHHIRPTVSLPLEASIAQVAD